MGIADTLLNRRPSRLIIISKGNNNYTWYLIYNYNKRNTYKFNTCIVRDDNNYYYTDSWFYPWLSIQISETTGRAFQEMRPRSPNLILFYQRILSLIHKIPKLRFHRIPVFIVNLLLINLIFVRSPKRAHKITYFKNTYAQICQYFCTKSIWFFVLVFILF